MKRKNKISAFESGIGGELGLVIDAVIGIFIIAVVLGVLYMIISGFKVSVRDITSSDANLTEALMNQTMAAVTVIPRNLRLYATIVVFVGIVALVGLLIKIISGTGGGGRTTA